MLVQLIALLCISTITHASVFQKPHYPHTIFPKIIATKNAPPGPYNATQGIVDARGSLSTSIQYGIVYVVLVYELIRRKGLLHHFK